METNQHNAVWIASYPKSGNTWIHSVLRLAGKKYGFPQVDMDVYNIQKKKELPQVCPAVIGRLASNPCVVLKTHSAYKREGELHHFPGIELINAAYFHIYRNPLDVLLSYLNYTRLEYRANADSARYRTTLFIEMLGFDAPYDYGDWLGMNLEAIPQKNLDHALDYFSDNALMLKSLAGMSKGWLENTQSWFSAASDLPGHSVRYEDCLEDPEQFVKMCSLFAFNREDVLSALEQVNSRARSMAGSGNQDQTVFYNKMQAYYFTKFFSPGASRRFLSKYENTLKDFGYEAIFDLV